MKLRPLRVAIIGAGISGSFLAYLLGREGLTAISLYEKRPTPVGSVKLGKVCGGCLHHRGVDILIQHGLGHLIQPGTPLNNVQLTSPEGSVSFAIPHGRWISRRFLDEALRVEAQRNGANLHYKQAKILDPQRGEVTVNGGVQHFDMVVDCTGVAGNAYHYESETKAVYAGFGLQGFLGQSHQTHPWLNEIRVGQVKFLIDDAGYHGVVRTDDPEAPLHVASYMRGKNLHTSPFLKEFFSLDDLHEKTATPSLYRRRASSEGKVFLCGDALGYPEPFTGEGMRFALETAEALGKLIGSALKECGADTLSAINQIHCAWQETTARLQTNQWRRCRVAAWVLETSARRRRLFPVMPWIAPFTSKIW